jgi:diguanylate cyclase (GGDEF)-like protein
VLYRALILHEDDTDPHHIAPALAELGCERVELGDGPVPDVIVVDVADAAAACLRLASSRLRGTPILAIVEPAEMANAFDAGADDCIARPTDHAELVARVRGALRIGIERARRDKREGKLSEELRKLQREKHALEKLACVDSLTGVANRRHTLALLDAEWKRSARDGTPLSLVMIDLDCFHAFNERYGHVGGDDCLRRASGAMVACLRRPSDFLGRYGGEEFVAVLANTDAIGAKLVAERLRVAVEALAIAHDASGCAPVVTISVGFATCTARAELVYADLLSKADHALLTAKALGKNRVIGDAPAVPSRAPVSPLPWMRFPAVVADPWFADRIPAFLDARRGDARAMADARACGAFDRIRGITRRMRDAAVEHGFELIHRLAGVIEHAARDRDNATVTAALDELVQYVDHVQVTYRRPLEQAG